RQWLAREGVEDHVRNQLLGEVIRAVVVGAIGHEGWQPIGALPSAHQVIRAGLGRRVRRAGSVWGSLGEQIVRTLQISIYLIGRNMMKTEGGFRLRFKSVPIAPCRF